MTPNQMTAPGLPTTWTVPMTASQTNAYSPDDLQRALAAWSDVLGSQYVRSDVQTIANYARTTLPRGTTPAAVVYPESSQQVQQVVRIANQYKHPAASDQSRQELGLRRRVRSERRPGDCRSEPHESHSAR